MNKLFIVFIVFQICDESKSILLGDTVKPIIIALLLISRISREVMMTRILLALIYVQIA